MNPKAWLISEPWHSPGFPAFYMICCLLRAQDILIHHAIWFITNVLISHRWASSMLSSWYSEYQDFVGSIFQSWFEHLSLSPDHCLPWEPAFWMSKLVCLWYVFHGYHWKWLLRFLTVHACCRAKPSFLHRGLQWFLQVQPHVDTIHVIHPWLHTWWYVDTSRSYAALECM